jgi:DNA-3-methyladenine glycosylase
MPQSLKAPFFNRDTREVARELLGCVLIVGEVRICIAETEAYIPGDSASHSYRGKTRRNAPMWGPPGHLYVYLCYGIHRLLNLVTEAEGRPAAVLLRGGRVEAGEALVRKRRGGRLDCIGPGKLSQALGVEIAWSGQALGERLGLVHGEPPAQVQALPRVGIDYAAPQHRDAPWRFVGG